MPQWYLINTVRDLPAYDTQVATYLDMFEVEHISLNKRIPDFLIRPCDKQFIIMIRLKDLGKS